MVDEWQAVVGGRKSAVKDFKSTKEEKRNRVRNGPAHMTGPQ